MTIRRYAKELAVRTSDGPEFLVAFHRQVPRTIENDLGEPIGRDMSMWLYGGSSPTLFKTLRNARRYTGDDPKQSIDYGDGVTRTILLFDPTLLPVVLEDDTIPKPDRPENEVAFAERQMLLWSERFVALGGRR